MHSAIRVSHESARGCGFRKTGGYYLVADGLALPCGAFPIQMTVCPTCYQGIKPARGFTWINPQPFQRVQRCASDYCAVTCPGRTSSGITQAGLLWIGEQFYPTPESFTREAGTMGVSRRIAQAPKNFHAGETWVFVGHRKCIKNPRYGADDTEPEFFPGLFHAFKPTAVEVIVEGSEPDEEIDKYVKRGLKPVKVIQEGPGQQETLDLEC